MANMKITCLALAVVLSGCAQKQNEESFSSYQSPEVQPKTSTLDTIEYYKYEPEARSYLDKLNRCDSSISNIVSVNISSMELDIDKLQYRKQWGIASSIAQKTLSLRFDLADKLLDLKCYKLANEEYRKIVKIYTGSSYSAYRERAMIGINDSNRKGK